MSALCPPLPQAAQSISSLWPLDARPVSARCPLPQVVQAIKQTDSFHPVGMVVSGISPSLVAQLNQYVPLLDFLARRRPPPTSSRSPALCLLYARSMSAPCLLYVRSMQAAVDRRRSSRFKDNIYGLLELAQWDPHTQRCSHSALAITPARINYYWPQIPNPPPEPGSGAACLLLPEDPLGLHFCVHLSALIAPNAP